MLVEHCFVFELFNFQSDMWTLNMTESKSTVHLLPFSIDYSGPAPVSSYFQTETDSAGNLAAHFRGRALQGKAIEIPKAICGLIATKKVKDLIFSNKEDSIETEGTFDVLTLWQHDVPPESSQFQDYFDWFDIAKSVSKL